MGMEILSHICIYNTLLSEDLDRPPVTTFINEDSVRFYVSRLFLPTAYGDLDLLARARARLARSFLTEILFRDERQNLSWRAIQNEFFNDHFDISWDTVAGKPHLRAWLRRQGVKKSLGNSFNAFRKRWRRATKLPSLERTLEIYPRR